MMIFKLEESKVISLLLSLFVLIKSNLRAGGRFEKPRSQRVIMGLPGKNPGKQSLKNKVISSPQVWLNTIRPWLVPSVFIGVLVTRSYDPALLYVLNTIGW